MTLLVAHLLTQARAYVISTWQRTSTPSTPCILWTDGITNMPYDDDVVNNDSQLLCTKAQGADYIYSALPNQESISSMIVVTAWTDGFRPTSSKGAFLEIGFSRIDPAQDTALASGIQWRKHRFSYNRYSAKIDLSSAPAWGNFIIIRAQCTDFDVCY